MAAYECCSRGCVCRVPPCGTRSEAAKAQAKCLLVVSRHTRCVAALLLCSVRVPPHKRAATWHVAFATALCACEGSRRGVRPARAGVRTADCGTRVKRDQRRDGSIGNIMHGKRTHSGRRHDLGRCTTQVVHDSGRARLKSNSKPQVEQPAVKSKFDRSSRRRSTQVFSFDFKSS